MKEYDKNTIKRVCHKYAYDKFSTRESIVADDEFKTKKLNPSKVTKYLHLGIKLNIIDDETARAIEQKAINNALKHCSSCYKLKETYRQLFEERKKLKQQKINSPSTNNGKTIDRELKQQDAREIYREFFNNTYPGVFSDGDEFPEELLKDLLYENEED